MKKFFDLKAKELFDELIARISGSYDDREAESLVFLALENKLKMSRAQLLVNHPVKIEIKILEELDEVVRRLNRYEPIQYILGRTEFYGLTFKVTPAVLIPRHETEELVQLVINENRAKPAKILDIGTGSGCIATSLKKNMPDSEVYATDNSVEALKLAKENALLNRAHIKFVHADILHDPVPGYFFDIWVSNPPYVRRSERKHMSENVLNYEPENALFVSDEEPFLFYEKIMALGKAHLKEGGKLYFEINENLGRGVEELFAGAGYRDIRILKDINGKDRMACGVRG